jgi:hypothetical protein
VVRPCARGRAPRGELGRFALWVRKHAGWDGTGRHRRARRGSRLVYRSRGQVSAWWVAMIDRWMPGLCCPRSAQYSGVIERRRVVGQRNCHDRGGGGPRAEAERNAASHEFQERSAPGAAGERLRTSRKGLTRRAHYKRTTTEFCKGSGRRGSARQQVQRGGHQGCCACGPVALVRRRVRRHHRKTRKS